MARVGVIGLWHLGSIYSACLAELGHDVIGVDSNAKAIANFNTGRAPLFEPGLDDLISKNLKAKRLSFTTDFDKLADREFIFIAYDTPVDENDKSDLTEIVETVKKIAQVKKDKFVLVVSSQVPVGSCDKFAEIIRKQNPSLEFDIAYLPENLRLGDALNVFLKADRFVVGANNPAVYEQIGKVLEGTNAPLVTVSLKSAETAKHALNSFLATCVSFTNELADFCELVGADVTQVSEALKSDMRIGRKAYLNAGLGFAGGTLARDLITLTDLGRQSDLKLPVIEGVLQTNANRPDRVIAKLGRVIGSLNSKTTVGVLGLTYKPGTSTLRRSISLEIIKRLREKGVNVKAYDPKADLSELKEKQDFVVVDTPEELAKDTSALLIVTGWPEFQQLNYANLIDLMKKPVILDLINFATPENREKAVKLGFRYYGTGIGGEK